MFGYNLRLAWKSLLRHPVMSLVTIAAIGLGVAVATTFVTTYYLLSADPLPDKSDELFYVRLDAWNPDRPWDDDDPDRPPVEITYTDALGLMASDIPTHHSAMFKALLFVHPEDPAERPFQARTRLCFRGFFPMFDVPFAYGGPWTEEADAGPEPVVVLDAATNARLFGGRDSVGEKLRIDQRVFTVVGVLAPWRPTTKFYDTHNDPQQAPEEIYIPFQLVREMEIATDGNIRNWKSEEGDDFATYLRSESIWIQMWVELDSAEQQAAYQSFLDAYALDQRELGRFQRPINNWIQPMMAWLEEDGAVPPEARSLMVISLLFLVVCSVNLIGLLLGKFLARAPEVGVRRALGASRWAVFLQHVVECQMIGFFGGLLGLVLSTLSLRLASRFFTSDFTFHLDLRMVLTGILLALVAGLVAGLYPAWRVCRVAPAVHLKLQ